MNRAHHRGEDLERLRRTLRETFGQEVRDRKQEGENARLPEGTYSATEFGRLGDEVARRVSDLVTQVLDNAAGSLDDLESRTERTRTRYEQDETQNAEDADSLLREV